MARAERPLQGEDGPVLRFAADLRELRAKAGSPPYRELSRQAHYSSGALSDAAAGRKLPTLSVTLAYVRACGGDPAEWERRWREVTEELAAPAVVEADEGSPYVGLAAFGADDAGWFFGRDRLVGELCARVRQRRFVAVVGPSGSGKSSLLRAGLLHAWAEGLHGLRAGPVVLLSPGPRPLEECAVALAGLLGGSVAGLLAELRADGDRLHLAALQAPGELLVVVDQFEELFTVCRDPAERARFLDLLHAAVHAPNSSARVVLGLRADFYGHCAQHPELVEVLRDGQVIAGPMTTEELRSAITGPAERGGCRVETALVSQVVADATGQAGALPLVSHALLETWRRRRGTHLTLAGYEAAGGMARAVAHTAEAVYDSLSEEQRRRARDLFVRLVELGEGTEDTKRNLPRTELDPEVEPVLEKLASARLVTVGRDTVGIVHEALIRSWPKLRGWLDDDRESLRRHRQLTDATAVWESLDRDTGALYRGTQLALAQTIADSGLTRREREFLAASRTADRRRVHRSRYLLALLVVLLVVSTTATVSAWRTGIEVTTQRNVALSQKVTAQAIVMRATNRPLAVQLSLAAYRLAPTAEARDGLLGTSALPLDGHRDYVNAVVFSPDGRTLYTAGRDRTIGVWDVADPAAAKLVRTVDTGHADNIFGLALSPDGRILATASRDTTAKLWDVGTARNVATLTGHTDAVYSVAFSPDGTTIGSGSWDRTARLWDITNLEAPVPAARLTGFGLNVKQVAFSSDGLIFAAGSDDRTVHLWDTANRRAPVSLTTLHTGHDDMVSALAFSPDGALLATGSDDRTIRLFDMNVPSAPQHLATLAGHAEVVMAVTFSPDGKTLASSSDDRMVRLWDVGDPLRPSEKGVLPGHNGPAQSVRFSPDGRWLASASTDHTAQLWDVDPARAERAVCAEADSAITRAEWEHYFPDLDFQPPCP